MVHAQAHGSVVLAAEGYERHQRIVDALQFGFIGFVGVGELFESASRVHKIAGIDAHFVGYGCGGKSGFGIEVNIRHQWHLTTLFAQCRANAPDIVGFLHPLRSESHNLAACLGYGAALCHTGFNVVGIGVGHRLHPHCVFAPQQHAPHIHFHRRAALIIKNRIHQFTLNSYDTCAKSRLAFSIFSPSEAL